MSASRHLTPLIHDCDPGPDDSLALMISFASSSWDVVGIEAGLENATQRLLPAGIEDPEAIAAAGLRFVDVQHDGCGQKSEEEAQRLLQSYNALINMPWIDDKGANRVITQEDILVVTPYNMQVDLLERTLPAGTKVGTVDRFQGQEAAVVLISMVTSSGEDLPRNIEFLFSRNRLNVAISRARCLAVIYANPRLLEIPCNSIEQMRLVNTLCWAKNYSATSNMKTEKRSARGLIVGD